MFTGLVRTSGEIRRVDQRGDRVFAIAMAEPFAIDIGDSVACHGMCLTVMKITGHEFKVSVSEESLRCTNAGDWKVGTIINLEPSLRIGDSLGGHFVSGHVDGLARATRHEPVGDSHRWEFEVPPSLARFIAPKGSVTLDGVSLTVNTVQDGMRSPQGEPQSGRGSDIGRVGGVSPLAAKFTINIIPHTTKMTSFGRLKVGESVNLEVDMLARYVARLSEKPA